MIKIMNNQVKGKIHNIPETMAAKVERKAAKM